MVDIISIPPIRMPVAKPIPVPFPRPISLDESCVLALLPGGQNSAIWQDESGQDNHGVVTGAIIQSNGQHGKTLYFDGIDDYCLWPSPDASLLPTTALTICVWIKPIADSTDNTVFFVQRNDTNKQGYYLHIQTENKIEFRCGNDSVGVIVTSDSAITSDEWIFVCITYDNVIVKMYIDAVLQAATAALTGPIVYDSAKKYQLGIFN